MLLAREPDVPAGARADLLEGARYHWSIPLQVMPSEENLRYFHRLCAADAELARALADAMPLAAAAAAEGRTATVRSIERRDVSSISREDFVRSYASPRVPVVLTGVSTGSALPTLEDIVRVCGAQRVTLQRSTVGLGGRSEMGGPAPAAWAGMHRAPGTTTLAELHAELQRGGVADGWQLFDWALPRHCPEAAQMLFAQSWLPLQLLQGSELIGLPPDAEANGMRCVLAGGFPSLFLQPADTGCAPHIDAYGTHFWQLVLQGRKTWRVAPAGQAHLLAPHPPRVGQQTFNYPCTDQANVLFVPAGSPHQVLNRYSPDEGSPALVAALSANFIDETNVREAETELYLGAELGSAPDVACTHEHVRRAMLALHSVESAAPDDSLEDRGQERTCADSDDGATKASPSALSQSDFVK
ncbi:hypothetical protein T492DRAFT_950256 [Pavlovales sp. CCMP2436]|nr:hypothetical protein T492DRAFT_950256 [Pavlovales sp. CCMP2436]